MNTKDVMVLSGPMKGGVMVNKSDSSRRVIIKGILDIMRRKLQRMDDNELERTMIEAWCSENEPQDNVFELPEQIDAHVGRN